MLSFSDSSFFSKVRTNWGGAYELASLHYKRIVIRRNIMEARTQGGGTNVAMEGPGAESGPWGGPYLKPKLWG